jgi:hypothetical protein
MSKDKTKAALEHKINVLNDQIADLIYERDALLRMYIGDFDEIITDADYTVIAIDNSSSKH